MLLLRVLPDDAFGSSRPCHPVKNPIANRELDAKTMQCNEDER
jgi:hypothetical protein